MSVAWQHSANELGRILRRHRLEPDAITNVALAWQAFTEFMHIEVCGLDPNPDSDADGFIVQWAATPGMTAG